MRKTLLLLAACALLAVPQVQAQTATTTCPSTKTPDELIKAIDAAVSGSADKDRTCMRQLFVADGRLIPIGKAKDGSIAARVLSVEDWISRVKARGSDAFYEHQIKYQSDIYGNMAHLWSTYEITPTPGGKVEVRGINSIQAAFNGTEWKVIEIVWQAETTDTPLPQKYLP
jgi:hypothetical protein